MEETRELRAQALINVVVLLLLKYGCITGEEAEVVLDLTLGDNPLVVYGLMLTTKGLLNLILGLEDRALSCGNKEVAMVAAKLLRDAWKELNGERPVD